MTKSRTRLDRKPLRDIQRHTDLSTGKTIQVPFRTSLVMALNASYGMTIEYSGSSQLDTVAHSPLVAVASGECAAKSHTGPTRTRCIRNVATGQTRQVNERTR